MPTLERKSGCVLGLLKKMMIICFYKRLDADPRAQVRLRTRIAKEEDDYLFL